MQSKQAYRDRNDGFKQGWDDARNHFPGQMRANGDIIALAKTHDFPAEYIAGYEAGHNKGRVPQFIFTPEEEKDAA